MNSATRARPMHEMIRLLTELVQSPKAGAIVAGLTGGTGAATVLDLVPQSDADKLYTLVGTFGLLCGGILSIVLAWTHWQRFKLEKRKYEEGRNREPETTHTDRHNWP